MKAIALVMAVLVAGLAWYFSREQAIPVPLYRVEAGMVEQIAANSRAGTIRACHRSRLSLLRGGRVEQLLVAEGDRVKPGQLLLQLHDKEQQVTLQQASAAVKAARLELQRSCQGADLAGRELERARGLAAQKLVSAEQLDRLRTDARIKKLACDLAAVEVEQSEVARARAEVVLEDMQLRAPYAGIVAEINGEPGEYTTPSPPGVATPPAVDLIDDSCLYVRAPIDEVEAAKLQVGQPARITLDAFRGRNFVGRLNRIAPYVSELEKQARTVDVDVVFDQVPEDALLLVGYSADVEIIIQQQEQQLRIPTDTLLEGQYVLRFNPDTSMLEKKQVETALANWSWTGIRTGLEPGERILSRLDTEGAVEGARVVPQ